MRRWFSVMVLFTVLLVGCSTTAERQIETSAFEACRGKGGDAFDTCVADHRALGWQQNAERNDQCLETIRQQEDRAAMIDGRRPGDPTSDAAAGC